jgi:hypothetical protein
MFWLPFVLHESQQNRTGQVETFHSYSNNLYGIKDLHEVEGVKSNMWRCPQLYKTFSAFSKMFYSSFLIDPSQLSLHHKKQFEVHTIFGNPSFSFYLLFPYLKPSSLKKDICLISSSQVKQLMKEKF